MSYKDIQVNNRAVLPVDLGIWGTVIFDPSDANPSFIGLHINKSALQTANDWRIYKFYTNTEIQIEHGSWSARTLLF